LPSRPCDIHCVALTLQDSRRDNAHRRLIVHDEDPARVEQILLSIAAADRRVIDDPAPAVRFTNFGASSLDFSLRVWTRNIDERWTMVSEMRYLIFERFKQAGIEIPYNQLDLHVRSDDTRALQEPAAPEQPVP